MRSNLAGRGSVGAAGSPRQHGIVVTFGPPGRLQDQIAYWWFPTGPVAAARFGSWQRAEAAQGFLVQSWTFPGYLSPVALASVLSTFVIAATVEGAVLVQAMASGAPWLPNPYQMAVQDVGLFLRWAVVHPDAVSSGAPPPTVTATCAPPTPFPTLREGVG